MKEIINNERTIHPTDQPEFKRMTNCIAFFIDFCKGREERMHLYLFIFPFKEDKGVGDRKAAQC